MRWKAFHPQLFIGVFFQDPEPDHSVCEWYRLVDVKELNLVAFTFCRYKFELLLVHFPPFVFAGATIWSVKLEL